MDPLIKPTKVVKAKSKQSLKSFDVIVTGVLVFVFAICSVTILRRAWQGRLKDIAKVESEKIATKIIASTERASDQRLPAATRIGDLNARDPWGEKYSRRWIETKDRSSSYLVVWSYGPNGKNDSNLKWLESRGETQRIFSGDDVGVVVSRKEKGRESSPDSAANP